MEFKDYDIRDFCNPNEENAFAIELEVSHRDSGLHNDYKKESNKIYEFLGVHDLSEEKRLDLLEKVTDIYYDKFPVGYSDDYISGGVHFLLFGDFEDLYEKEDYILKDNLLNCPLYCKISKDKKAFYTRELSNYCDFNYFDYIPRDSKGTPVTLKHKLLSNGGHKDGIEFRLNNVIDPRLLGYYQAQVILFKEGVELEQIPSNNLYYLKKGDKYSYDGDYVELGDLKDSFTPNEEQLKVIKNNIKTIFKTLEDNNLPKSKEALRQYLVEYNILEEKITF